MASDPRLLLAGLQEYSQALEIHFVELRERHAKLYSAWWSTSEVYQGTGAEVFAEAFMQADARFKDYLERGAQILVMLRDQMERLRQFDIAGGPIL